MFCDPLSRHVSVKHVCPLCQGFAEATGWKQPAGIAGEREREYRHEHCCIEVSGHPIICSMYGKVVFKSRGGVLEAGDRSIVKDVGLARASAALPSSLPGQSYSVLGGIVCVEPCVWPMGISVLGDMSVGFSRSYESATTTPGSSFQWGGRMLHDPFVTKHCPKHGRKRLATNSLDQRARWAPPRPNRLARRIF